MLTIAAALALISAGSFIAPRPASAQDPSSPAFAAGGLSNWGASVTGSGAAAATGPDGATAAKPAAPPAKPRGRSAKRQPPAAKASSPTEPQAIAKTVPPAKFAPAGIVPHGPIIVRPPPERIPQALATTAPAAAAPTANLAPGECLAVNQIGPGAYQIENAGCRNAAVLATIEIRNGRGSRSITCYIARIRDAYAVTSPPGAPPRINHQCRDGTPGCAETVLKSMFPECRGSV